jgi:methylated-DNA-[protein]-cysteine S-methyltransferase
MKGKKKSLRDTRGAPGRAGAGQGECYYDTFDSPLGRVTVVVDRAGRLAGLSFSKAPGRTCGCAPVRDAKKCSSAKVELEQYFSGARKSFDIECSFVCGTPFQRSVWEALCEIPFGKTESYAELARRIGRPGACRAVGNAAGANPIPIVVPCHRLIAANGKLGGYGSGLDKKIYLLGHEK